MMQKNKIYQGSNKILYQSDDDFALILSFTDEIKVDKNRIITIPGKAVLNNNISSFAMNKLDMIGVDNHLIQKLNMFEQIVQVVDAIPVQVRITNVAQGRYVTQFGMDEGYIFTNPMIDFRIKNSELDYPPINESQIISFQWLDQTEISRVKNIANRISDFLAGMFCAVGIRLVECKLEFGKVFDGEKTIIMLIDEITPESCKLWDIHTNEKLCFDIETAEEDCDKLLAKYKEVAKRLNLHTLFDAA